MIGGRRLYRDRASAISLECLDHRQDADPHSIGELWPSGQYDGKIGSDSSQIPSQGWGGMCGTACVYRGGRRSASGFQDRESLGNYPIIVRVLVVLKILCDGALVTKQVTPINHPIVTQLPSPSPRCPPGPPAGASAKRARSLEDRAEVLGLGHAVDMQIRSVLIPQGLPKVSCGFLTCLDHPAAIPTKLGIKAIIPRPFRKDFFVGCRLPAR